MLKIFIKSITIIFVLTFMSTAHAGDASKGKKVFNKCKACHGIDEGGKK
jgi:cytochrome c